MKNQSKIQLLIRADDIGSSQAANQGCIAACTRGIARSVEIMVPCPWFEDACQQLNANPEIDVGIHLTMTSEWEGMKWGPLTGAPSVCEAPGRFFPALFASSNFTKSRALAHQPWSITELEAEFRAQIELGLTRIPAVSHISYHMALHFRDFDPSVGQLSDRLAVDYGLDIDLDQENVRHFEAYQRGRQTFEAREASFLDNIRSLTSGRHIFIDHPAMDTPEMRAIGHKGYENVARDRNDCLKVFTSPRVLADIDRLGIELISYRDLM